VDACPTDALTVPGELDATRCLSYWTQAADPIPEPVREALGDRVYGCDICQDVCPWNRGTEKRRAGEPLPQGAEPAVSLVDWLTATDDDLTERYERLFVPRNDPRFLRRNALVAAGNSGDTTLLPLVREAAESDDDLVREHAAWAESRLAGVGA
jgi:epoxyqueuosine reductase